MVNDSDKALNGWIGDHLFDLVPSRLLVVDDANTIIRANTAFYQEYGEWRDKKCYELFEVSRDHCQNCGVTTMGKKENFPQQKTDQEFGTGQNGCHFLASITPGTGPGTLSYLLEAPKKLRQEYWDSQRYRNLFEHVPCDIFIVDRDYKIKRANSRSKKLFGSIEGAYCYTTLKHRATRCDDCTAHLTFNNGQPYTGRSTVVDKDGQKTELLVTTVPYEMKDGHFDYVMEMAIDITPTLELQEELKVTNTTMRSLIASSLYGIVAIDETNHVTVINQAARRMLSVAHSDRITWEKLKPIFSTSFLDQVNSSETSVYVHETEILDFNGELFPARLTGIKLGTDGDYRGKAFWIHDIRKIKRLESEKLEAERLAAVGKTVAGLAHGIKNVLTGLEGGEYMLNSGLRKGDTERIEKGLGMLSRNTARVSTFVKEFLNFSKGQDITVSLNDPREIVKDVVNNYFVKTRQLGISLKAELQDDFEPVALDSEGIHDCLSNLLGNAIDACRISEHVDKLHIVIRAKNTQDAVIFEVIDNGCGMDYEIKRKIFTTFFTTKGLGGTGLGLLMTKKIIQQHGGFIEFDSIVNQGTTFRITLPHDRLPAVNIA